MSYLKRTALAALALGLAACGQGDGGNVMGAGANSLTPAQVDAALGPEVANEAGNALDNAGDANAADADDQPATAAPADRRAAPRAAPEPADEPEDNAPETTVQDNENAL